MRNKEFLDESPEELDKSRVFLEAVPRLVRMARRAAHNEGISYRGVQVGAAAMFISREPYRENLLSGANLKVKPTDEKYCAEMDVIDQAMALELREATGLVIAGPSAANIVSGISGTTTPTLHPCDSCQKKMAENPEIISPETLIITTSTEENVYQVHSADELLMLYGALETRELMFLESATRLDFPAWGERISLYDDLRSQNPGTSKQYLAKIALENIVDMPDLDD